MCTGTVSTGSENIKWHEIITIRGNRVRAGQVLMSAIDMVQSVFCLGLSGLSVDKKRQHWRMQRSGMMIGIASGFIRVSWGGGLGGRGHDSKFNSTRK